MASELLIIGAASALLAIGCLVPALRHHVCLFRLTGRRHCRRGRR